MPLNPLEKIIAEAILADMKKQSSSGNGDGCGSVCDDCDKREECKKAAGEWDSEEKLVTVTLKMPKRMAEDLPKLINHVGVLVENGIKNDETILGHALVAGINCMGEMKAKKDLAEAVKKELLGGGMRIHRQNSKPVDFSFPGDEPSDFGEEVVKNEAPAEAEEDHGTIIIGIPEEPTAKESREAKFDISMFE